ncbi:hypothetical protein EYV94_28145 [Puteibacter caeruleilacunae]|nr:hypothetical protein EYV94_28145 [Puteibacter caeruleilacunae]
MKKDGYSLEAKVVAEIIDIAIKCIKDFPPEEFNAAHVKHFVNVYSGYKEDLLNPDSKFRNMKSLQFAKNDVLTYFQEGKGPAVEAFWKEVNSRHINVKRVNKIQKILRRGKIVSKIEFDTVTDLLIPYIQSNMLSEEDVTKLNELIQRYESSH